MASGLAKLPVRGHVEEGGGLCGGGRIGLEPELCWAQSLALDLGQPEQSGGIIEGLEQAVVWFSLP